MLGPRCVAHTWLWLAIATGVLLYFVGPQIPKPWYLVTTYWPWLLGYWVAAWLNIASLAYLVIKRFTLLEIGRKLQQADPARNPNGLFADELRDSDVRA